MNAAIGHSKKFTRRNLNTFHQPTKQNRLLYHSQCAVNLRCGPKLAVVATRDRHNLFLEKPLIIWCPGYLSDNLFYTIATEKKTNPQSRLTSWFNYSDLMSQNDYRMRLMITENRDIAIKGKDKTDWLWQVFIRFRPFKLRQTLLRISKTSLLIEQKQCPHMFRHIPYQTENDVRTLEIH